MLSDCFNHGQAVCAHHSRHCPKSPFLSELAQKCQVLLLICAATFNWLCSYLKKTCVSFLFQFLTVIHIAFSTCNIFSLLTAVFSRWNHRYLQSHTVQLDWDRSFQSLPLTSKEMAWKYPCKLILVNFLKFFRFIAMFQEKEKRTLNSFFRDFLSNSPLACTDVLNHFSLLRIQVFLQLAKRDRKIYS